MFDSCNCNGKARLDPGLKWCDQNSVFLSPFLSSASCVIVQLGRLCSSWQMATKSPVCVLSNLRGRKAPFPLLLQPVSELHLGGFHWSHAHPWTNTVAWGTDALSDHLARVSYFLWAEGDNSSPNLHTPRKGKRWLLKENQGAVTRSKWPNEEQNQ